MLYPKTYQMKKLLIFTFLFNSYLAQEPKTDFEIFNCQPIKENFLWAAETELTNIQYLEFLSYLKINQGKETYNEMLPDTLVWREKSGYGEPYVEYYFRHPVYRSYPLVGVSKAQAETYCEWLENRLNEYYSKDPKHPIQKLDVRLPTDEEWQLAARGGNPNAIFPWDGEELRRTDKKFKGQICANYVRGRGDYMGIAGNLNDKADVTAPVKSYWPNNYGLYNMSGNVAEMIQEERRTRGGSWGSRAPFLEIDGADEFEGFSTPNSKIGFRYFIEVVSFKPIKAVKEIELTAKLIEELLQNVPDKQNLQISKYEVSNQLYNLFLKSPENAKHTSDNSLWLSEMDYPRRIANNYSSHPDYENHPVVNISKESAQAFCNWLTQEYKKFPNRKFKDFEFRLPTEEEWEMSAKGGLDLSPYPWGGPYIRNAKGSRLCNYRPAKDRWIMDKGSVYIVPGISESDLRSAGAQDGLLITGPVDSYHANDYGVYCMSGNVAEMVSDKNITKGGSWGSISYYTQISSSEPFEGASPYVGFRFVGSTSVEVSSSKIP